MMCFVCCCYGCLSSGNEKTAANQCSSFVAFSYSLFSRRSAYRTYACTSTALNASISVDNVLSVALRNCAYRALSLASSAA